MHCFQVKQNKTSSTKNAAEKTKYVNEALGNKHAKFKGHILSKIIKLPIQSNQSIVICLLLFAEC